MPSRGYTLFALFALITAAGFAHAAEHPNDYLTVQQLRAKYAERGAKYMDIDGVEVYYKDEGSGPAILMIHGSVSSLRTYDGVAAKLKSRYRIIRYDIPPGGLSGPVSDAAVAALKPEDVPETLLTRLGVKSATVVGVSSGGTTGYFFAAKRSDMVERLILSNTPADVVDTSHLKLSKPMMQAQGAAYDASTQIFKTRQYWNAFLDFFSGEPVRITPAIREEYYDMNRRTPERHATDLVAKVANHPLTVATAQKVTCPVLLVWGARDPLLGPASADVLAAYLKNAQVSKLMLPDVGHYPPLEVPERYAQIIAAYIEAVTPFKPKAPPPADR